MKTVADVHRQILDACPPMPNFLRFHAVFRQILPKTRLAPPSQKSCACCLEVLLNQVRTHFLQWIKAGKSFVRHSASTDLWHAQKLRRQCKHWARFYERFEAVVFYTTRRNYCTSRRCWHFRPSRPEKSRKERDVNQPRTSKTARSIELNFQRLRQELFSPATDASAVVDSEFPRRGGTNPEVGVQAY